MQSASTQTRGALVVGGILVALGILLLIGQQTDLALGSVTWPIVIGVAVFLVGVALGGDRGTGFAALGGIIAMVGVVLAVQRESGAFLSWMYAWALVAPGGVGLGLALYGLLTWQAKPFRDGVGALVAGLVLFLIGFILVEGVWDLFGRGDTELVTTVAPLALIGLGGVLFLAAFVWPYFDRRPDLTGASWSTAGATAGSPAGAAAGAAAMGAAADGSTRDDAVQAAIELAGAPSADVELAFGAGNLAIRGPASSGHLLDGTFSGGVKREDLGLGRVKLSTPGERIWNAPWDRAPFDWALGLTGEVPLRLTIKTGASKTEADLSALRLTELRIQTGAADTAVTLPAAAGLTRVFAEGGAAGPASAEDKMRDTLRKLLKEAHEAEALAKATLAEQQQRRRGRARTDSWDDEDDG